MPLAFWATRSPDVLASGQTAGGARATRDVSPKAMERRQRAVGYLRRSTDKQDQSIADQRAAIQRFANQHGLDLVRFYTVRSRLWSPLGYPDGLPVISGIQCAWKEPSSLDGRYGVTGVRASNRSNDQ